MSQTSTAAIPSGTLVVSTDVPRSRSLVQPVPADFYSLSDDDGRPIAGLIVLNDSGRRPVRAELHLVGVSTDETGRNAIRQAQRLLEERYRGPDALPMQVWQSFLRSDPLEVPLPPLDREGKGAKPAKTEATRAANPGTAATAAKAGSSAAASPAAASPASRVTMATLLALPWKWIGAATAALMVALLLWGIVNWWRGDSTSNVTVPNGGGIEAQAGDVAAEPSAAAAAAAVADPALAPLATMPIAEEALPASKNADPNLLVGKRFRVLPNIEAMALRTEAGATAGDVVGYLKGGMEGNIIGGPNLLRGDSDTIVWWEVQLDEGTQAWVAANTSKLQLIEAME